ncbi:MAG TPA: IQ calmodulin-binding motif-containing protein, partial [Gammaproteobacteria bacterium]|nr:IQ calmodulin-binding motif-containing protein [Gammaproteobacteria bacterium]
MKKPPKNIEGLKETSEESGIFHNFNQHKPNRYSTIFIFFEGTGDTLENQRCFMDPVALELSNKHPVLVLNGCGTVGNDRHSDIFNGTGPLGLDDLPETVLKIIREHHSSESKKEEKEAPSTTSFVLVGHSRGAVNAITTSKKLLNEYPDANVDVFAHDPVIGPQQEDPKRFYGIPKRIRNMHLICMLSEPRNGFEETIDPLNSPLADHHHLVFLPGNHAKQAIAAAKGKSAIANLLTHLLLKAIDDAGIPSSEIFDNMSRIANRATCQEEEEAYNKSFLAKPLIRKQGNSQEEQAINILALLEKSYQEYGYSTEKAWRELDIESNRNINQYFDYVLNGTGGSLIGGLVKTAFPRVAKIYFEGKKQDRKNDIDLADQIKQLQEMFPCVLSLLNYAREPLADIIPSSIDIGTDPEEGIHYVSSKTPHRVSHETMPKEGLSAASFKTQNGVKILAILKHPKDDRPFIRSFCDHWGMTHNYYVEMTEIICRLRNDIINSQTTSPRHIRDLVNSIIIDPANSELIKRIEMILHALSDDTEALVLTDHQFSLYELFKHTVLSPLVTKRLGERTARLFLNHKGLPKQPAGYRCLSERLVYLSTPPKKELLMYSPNSEMTDPNSSAARRMLQPNSGYTDPWSPAQQLSPAETAMMGFLSPLPPFISYNLLSTCKDRLVRKKGGAAMTIQKMIRGWLARINYQQLAVKNTVSGIVEQINKDQNAPTIQKMVRGWLARI